MDGNYVGTEGTDIEGSIKEVLAENLDYCSSV